LDLIIGVIFSEDYKWRSSSLWNSLHSLFTSSLRESSSAPCCRIPSASYVLRLVWETKFHTHKLVQIHELSVFRVLKWQSPSYGTNMYGSNSYSSAVQVLRYRLR
jgi:hypothetical protein